MSGPGPVFRLTLDTVAPDRPLAKDPIVQARDERRRAGYEAAVALNNKAREASTRDDQEHRAVHEGGLIVVWRAGKHVRSEYTYPSPCTVVA